MRAIRDCGTPYRPRTRSASTPDATITPALLASVRRPQPAFEATPVPGAPLERREHRESSATRRSATDASNRGDSYSWQMIALQPARRISRATAPSGVARYGAT